VRVEPSSAIMPGSATFDSFPSFVSFPSFPSFPSFQSVGEGIILPT
jgi:hypothetical protein